MRYTVGHASASSMGVQVCAASKSTYLQGASTCINLCWGKLYLRRGFRLHLDRVQKWAGWKRESAFYDCALLTSSFQVHFVPSLFKDPATFQTLPFLDGAFNVGGMHLEECNSDIKYKWNGGWPTQLSASSTPEQIGQAASSLLSDLPFLNGLAGKTYMAPVSPWFFTVSNSIT